MTTDYYPWNVPVLVQWLKQEMMTHQNAQALAAQLNVSEWVLRTWLTEPMPAITLDQIYGLARYRNWSLHQTFHWLGLKPAHIEVLLARDP